MAEQRFAQIHIADNKTDEILDFIPEHLFWNDERKRELKDNRDTFDFETFATESYSGALEERNRIIIPNRYDDSYSEFIIEEAAQILDDSGLQYKATYTTASYLELRKQKVIPPQTVLAQSPEGHVDFALEGTEWQKGNIEFAPNHTTVLTAYMDAYSYLQNVAAWSGLELSFRVEHNGYRVTGRYVDLVERSGVWRGYEAVFGKNLMSIERRRKFDAVVTALIGLGPDNDDGTPREEVYIESDAALARWGRNGKHLVEVFEPQSEDQNINPEKLFSLTQEELNRRISHQSEYVATIATLAEVLDVDASDLRFGDVIRIKDEEFNPPIYLEARIHEMTESIKAYGDSQVTLGDFQEFSEADVKSILKRLRESIADKVSNAELVEAIASIEALEKVTQATPPTDTSVVWIDNSNRPLVTKVWIDAVEGWVPIMPATAEEIGADPAGSADAALVLAREDIGEVVSDLDVLRNEYDTFMADGFISRSEALSIERHIAELTSEKSDVDADYTATYGNAKLGTTEKAALLAAKTTYNDAHTALVTTINNSIADGYVTPSEVTDVDNAFINYAAALGSYSTARANATYAITQAESTAQIDAIEDGGGVNMLVDEFLERGKYLNNDGTLLDDVPSFVTAPMNVEGFEHVTASTNGKSRYKELAFYDAAGVFIAPLISDDNAANTTLTAPVPANAVTVRFSSTDYEVGFFKIEKGKKATPWSPSPNDVDYNAQEKADAAQAAAGEYAAAEAELARISAMAYADGILTDEETARIEDAQNKLAEAKAYAEQKAQEAVEAIDNSDLATKEELEDATQAIKDQLTTRGGANLLRNSIGYAGLDFFNFTTSNQNVQTIMNEALTTLGFGCGFFFPPDGLGKGIQQSVNVVEGQEYTLGWYVQRASTGSFTIEILEGTTVIASSVDASVVGAGYVGNFLTFTPSTPNIIVRFTAAGTAEITLTGLMLGAGNLPMQWTLATGELYNAYVRVDDAGLLVLGLDEAGNVESKTVMSPLEFAGYYDENRDGNFERVFWLNKDETVTKKLRALEEITMGTIKIVRVESAANRGWAFVPIVPEE